MARVTTFMCDRYDYPEEALKQFSLQNNLRVIIRGYAEIKNGEMSYFDINDRLANKRRVVQ